MHKGNKLVLWLRGNKLVPWLLGAVLAFAIIGYSGILEPRAEQRLECTEQANRQSQECVAQAHRERRALGGARALKQSMRDMEFELIEARVDETGDVCYLYRYRARNGMKVERGGVCRGKTYDMTDYVCSVL
jgi:hypothetical protein